jgi:hypothetical protein
MSSIAMIELSILYAEYTNDLLIGSCILRVREFSETLLGALRVLPVLKFIAEGWIAGALVVKAGIEIGSEANEPLSRTA